VIITRFFFYNLPVIAIFAGQNSGGL